MLDSESGRLFQLTGNDPSVWLNQSEGLYVSACAVRDRLISIMDTPAMFRQTETMGLMNSSLLLLGLAVENAVKAVYIARDPELVSTSKLNKGHFNSDSGHGIKDFTARILTLTPTELALLDRLQEHVVWAGRYPIPIKSTRFQSSREPINKRSMGFSDFDVARSLLDRLGQQARRSIDMTLHSR